MSTNIPPRSSQGENNIDSAPLGPEKEQYSLDEMMKALRDKERAKEAQGEVVTRSDGTIARKVKRRRRRSEQASEDSPEREKKRLLVKVVIGATLILVLFLTVLFLILMQNSKGHRDKLAQQASEWSGAEVEFKGLKRMPFAVSIKEANFRWNQTNFVRNLSLNNIEGHVRFLNYLGARPSGLQIGGSKGQLRLAMPSDSGDAGDPLSEEDFPFDFDEYYCNSLDVFFGADAPIGFSKVDAIFSYAGGDGYQVTLDEGTFRVDGWEDFPVSKGVMRFKDGVLSLKALSLKNSPKSGISLASDLKLSGEVLMESGEKSTLEITTDQFPMDVLIGKKLSRFFSGSIVSSSGKVQFTVGNDYFDEVEIDLKASAAKMKRLPFLVNLHSLFPNHNLDLLEFHEGISNSPITGKVRAKPEGVALENFQFSEKGKVSLSGSLLITNDGRIRGRLEISINRFYLSSQERFKGSPHLVGSDTTGFVSFKFDVGGTVDRPTDTFLEMLGVDSTSLQVDDPTNESEDKIWENLINPRGEKVPPDPDILKPLNVE
ncbi:MAG: hypothetical protein P8M04_03810 [Akkermansiaceae bacterium]|nr:hypothetical protein [Akkermansiaceae bacterium]